jgi:hypothetical protein
MKLVAVQGFTHAISNPIVVATVAPTGTPSVKCKAGWYGICKDGFTMSVSAITVPSVGATIPDPGPYTATFASTAAKVKADGTLVLLEGDETGTVNASPQIPGNPNNTPYPVSFKLSVSAAGQLKVKAV